MFKAIVDSIKNKRKTAQTDSSTAQPDSSPAVQRSDLDEGPGKIEIASRNIAMFDDVLQVIQRYLVTPISTDEIRQILMEGPAVFTVKDSLGFGDALLKRGIDVCIDGVFMPSERSIQNNRPNISQRRSYGARRITLTRVAHGDQVELEKTDHGIMVNAWNDGFPNPMGAGGQSHPLPEALRYDFRVKAFQNWVYETFWKGIDPNWNINIRRVALFLGESIPGKVLIKAIGFPLVDVTGCVARYTDYNFEEAAQIIEHPPQVVEVNDVSAFCIEARALKCIVYAKDEWKGRPAEWIAAENRMPTLRIGKYTIHRDKPHSYIQLYENRFGGIKFYLDLGRADFSYGTDRMNAGGYTFTYTKLASVTAGEVLSDARSIMKDCFDISDEECADETVIWRNPKAPSVNFTHFMNDATGEAGVHRATEAPTAPRPVEPPPHVSPRPAPGSASAADTAWQIGWVSSALDDIGLVYEKADEDEVAARGLSQLETQALTEARQYCGKVSKRGMTPGQFDALSGAEQEIIIVLLGRMGIQSMRTDAGAKEIVVALSPAIQSVMGCAMFNLLNSIEKLDGALNEMVDGKITLTLQVPLGGRKGLVQWEMLIMKLYPWLSIRETPSNMIAVPLSDSMKE